MRRRIRGVRAILAFLLVGVFLARALIGTFTRVRRRIAGARTAVGRAFAWIGSGIAGAHAAVGRAFTRIGCGIAGVTGTPISRRVFRAGTI